MDTKERIQILYDKANRKRNFSSKMAQAFKEDEEIRKEAEKIAKKYINRPKKPNYFLIFITWVIIGFFTGWILSIFNII